MNSGALNEDGLAIALHHSSLDTGQRRRVEKAMVAGRRKASFASSTLDLGIDWGDVDLIINIGGKPPYSTNRPSQSPLTSPPGGTRSSQSI
jgi:Lhr-like helicase